MVAIAAVSAIRSQALPARALPSSQPTALSGDLGRSDHSALVAQLRARRSTLRIHALAPPARPTAGEQTERAPRAADPRDEFDKARILETELASGELDSSTAIRIAEHLVTSRARETEYVASVAQLLATSLQSNLAVDPPDAAELAYTTLIGDLLDGGDAESAQYLAQKAMAQLPDSPRVRAALATALAERLYYRDAIGVLREIQAPDARIQAQLATLLYRQGNTAEAGRLAARLRRWSADAAEMMEEIPE
jgi:tetratricopeptide (TPR) repeat protein